MQNLHIEVAAELCGISVNQQVLGELGALQLARREFTEALDCLVRAEFWVDAAYVAERVLSLEELKAYVDRHWPEVGVETNPAARGYFRPHDHPAGEIFVEPLTAGGRLRYLLGRRLARVHQGEEGRAYFPPGIRPALDTFLAATSTGTNLAFPTEQRAAALWRAACLTRCLGLELFGTEVGPDWAFHGGNYEEGPDTRARDTTGSVIRASSEELRRAIQPTADPELRFHYRYTAAELGWQAAKLMPDNSEATARVLCRAGTWLKRMDPTEADPFYKALVRRCRKTALGAAADQRHWFPPIDEAGNLLLTSEQ